EGEVLALLDDGRVAGAQHVEGELARDLQGGLVDDFKIDGVQLGSSRRRRDIPTLARPSRAGKPASRDAVVIGNLPAHNHAGVGQIVRKKSKTGRTHEISCLYRHARRGVGGRLGCRETRLGLPGDRKVLPPSRDDGKPKTAPGSTLALTRAQIDDLFNAPDWFPDMHPPMPQVVAHGNKDKQVRACASCHLPTGTGPDESAYVAGLPVGYF